MAMIRANATYYEMKSKRVANRVRHVVIPDALGGATLVDAIADRTNQIVGGYLELGSACAWEIKTGSTVLRSNRAKNAGEVIEFEATDEILSEDNTTIVIETDAACTVDGAIYLAK